jgi:hypothetical protein
VAGVRGYEKLPDDRFSLWHIKAGDFIDLGRFVEKTMFLLTLLKLLHLGVVTRFLPREGWDRLKSRQAGSLLDSGCHNIWYAVANALHNLQWTDRVGLSQVNIHLRQKYVVVCAQELSGHEAALPGLSQLMWPENVRYQHGQ